MNGWFIAIIALYVLSLGLTLGKHGEPKKDKYNFWSSLISAGIMITLVYQAIKTGL